VAETVSSVDSESEMPLSLHRMFKRARSSHRNLGNRTELARDSSLNTNPGGRTQGNVLYYPKHQCANSEAKYLSAPAHQCSNLAMLSGSH